MRTISEVYSIAKEHYKNGTFNWPMIIYLGLAHIAAIVGLFTIPYCKTQTLLWAFILWPIR